MSSGYEFTLVSPVSISRDDPATGSTDQIQANRLECEGLPSDVAAETSGTLTAADCFPQSSWVRWSRTITDAAGRVVARRDYRTIPVSGDGELGVDYDETTFGYDATGRQNRVRMPNGTITQTIFDVRGLTLSTWIGTNDTGATDAEPTGGGAAGNNMMQVVANEYDEGQGGGDGNLTQATEFIDSDSANSRITTFGYDFRNRRVWINGEMDLYVECGFDNLDHLIRTDNRDGSVGSILLERRETSFDEQGRVYQTSRYDVDPSTGALGNKLLDNTWHDANGNVIQSQSAASEAWTKTTFDGLNRAIRTQIGFTDGAGDKVQEQTDVTFDEAGSVIVTSFLQRLHDDTTSTGPLVANVNARPQYVAAWFNGVGQQIASTNYGTNNGQAFVRPESPPEE